MRIIGIDPGTATTGFCILDKENSEIKLLDYGCIKTSKDFQDSERLKQISDDIDTLIDKWNPEKASIEKLFFNKNVKTAMSVAQARGVIIERLENKNIKQKEYTPLQIKSAVCGYGKADKKMVQEMVRLTFGLKEIPKPDDAADAIAAALCLAHSYIEQNS